MVKRIWKLLSGGNEGPMRKNKAELGSLQRLPNQGETGESTEAPQEMVASKDRQNLKEEEEGGGGAAGTACLLQSVS